MSHLQLLSYKGKISLVTTSLILKCEISCWKNVKGLDEDNVRSSDNQLSSFYTELGKDKLSFYLLTHGWREQRTIITGVTGVPTVLIYRKKTSCKSISFQQKCSNHYDQINHQRLALATALNPLSRIVNKLLYSKRGVGKEQNCVLWWRLAIRGGSKKLTSHLMWVAVQDVEGAWDPDKGQARQHLHLPPHPCQL